MSSSTPSTSASSTRIRPTSRGPLALYEAIRSIFAGGDYPRFKVLFTCRSYTWKNLFHRCAARDAGLLFRSSGNDDEATAVRGFNDAELEQAYAIYRRLYQMETPFEALAGTSKIRLKDPLVLKIACTNYLGRELPQQTRPYASIALFGKMLDDISRSYAGNMQRRIIEMLAAYILDSYEHGMPVDSISSRALRSACGDSTSPLHEMANAIYKNDGITIATASCSTNPSVPCCVSSSRSTATAAGRYSSSTNVSSNTSWPCRSSGASGRRGRGADTAAAVCRRAARRAGNVVFMGAMLQRR